MDRGMEMNEDRISIMPETILTHILTFLPTKHVVGTSILSKRWENVWKGVPNMDFNDNLLFEKDKKMIEDRKETIEMNFIQHVKRVMLHTKVQRFQKISFALNNFLNRYDSDEGEHNNDLLDSWILSAINLNVRELDLSLLIKAYPVVLTPALFTSETLVRLNLEINGEIFMEVPAAVRLPNLKFLRLKSVIYNNEPAALRIISQCPVLEVLFLSRSLGDNCKNLRICIPTLKVLSVESTQPKDYLFHVRHPRIYMIKINCPNLEKLFLKDVISEEIKVQNLSEVSEAYIEVGLHCSSHSILSFLNGIPNVKVLRLFGSIASIFCKCNYPILPIYRNLISLELRATTNVHINFLECSPKLEVLNIQKVTVAFYSNFLWDLLTRVPECLLSHLKEITFHTSRGLIGELGAIQYLLENAKVLKKFRICSDMIDDANQASVIRAILQNFGKERDFELLLLF